VSERVRYHLDENVDPAIALGLRRYGIDVTTTIEAGLLTRSDETQLQFIRKTQRVIFTQDADFLIIASQTDDHPGIAYCKQGSRTIGQVIEALVVIYELLKLDDMKGHVEFL
jgi:predicted nuclease of predicted toxin-antitoxin system